MEINLAKTLERENISLDKDNRIKDAFNSKDIINNKNINNNKNLLYNKGIKEEMEDIINLEKELDLDIGKQDSDEDIIEEDLIFKSLLEDLDRNIFINVKKQEEEKNEMACRELLQIIKCPYSDFKPFLKPRKVSMIGRVFFNENYNEKKTIRENDSRE